MHKLVVMTRGGVSIAESERVERRDSGPAWSSVASSGRDFLPATPMSNRHGLATPWAATVERRVRELSTLREGWDSYGATPLTPKAVAMVSMALMEIDPYIQRPPQVSMTVDGGLLCEWESAEASLGLTVTGDGRIEVYYCEASTGREFEGPVADLEAIGKFFWRASAF